MQAIVETVFDAFYLVFVISIVNFYQNLYIY